MPAAGSDSQLPAVFGHPHRELGRCTVHFGACADVSFNDTGFVKNLTLNHTLFIMPLMIFCVWTYFAEMVGAQSRRS